MSKVSFVFGCMVETLQPDYPTGAATTTVTCDGREVEVLRMFCGSMAERMTHALGVDRARLHDAQVRSERGELSLEAFETEVDAYAMRLGVERAVYQVLLSEGSVES